MLLKDYAIPRARVTLPGKADKDGNKPFFEVRGLCSDDLTFLIQNHLEPISKAVKLYQESRSDILSTGSLQNFVMLVARDFPFVVAEVISAAADQLDDETRAVAGRLPLPTQITAINEIVRLTLEDAGGLGNLLAEMRARIESAAGIESGSATARPETK